MKKIVLAVWILTSGFLFSQWTHETNPGASFIFDVKVYENKLYAINDSVLFVKENSEWREIPILGFEAQSLNSVFAEGTTIVLGTSNNGAFLSRDAGQTWSHFKTGLSDNSLAITGFVTMNEYLYAGTMGGGVYRSPITQLTVWEPYNEGLSAGMSYNINSIYGEGGRLYISAGGNGYIFYRDMNSQNWMESYVADILPEITLFPEIISYGGMIYTAGSAGLYMSPDRGNTWQRVEGVSGSFDPVLLIAGDALIYSPLRLTSTASLYSVRGTTTPPQALFPLAQYAVGNGVYYSGRIYIPTAIGLYSREFQVTSVEPVVTPLGFSVLPVYPNPFNSSGMVVLKAAEAGEYKMEIIGLTGEVIHTSQFYLSEGTELRHRIEGGTLSSGTYFLRVKGKSGYGLSKFVVLK